MTYKYDLVKIKEGFMQSYGTKVKAKTVYGLYEGNPALYFDMGMAFKYMMVFESEKDFQKLFKLESSVDHVVYQGFKALRMFKKMKVKNNGTSIIESRPDTLIVRKISFSPFNKLKGSIIVRLDSYIIGKKARSTTEIPAKIHYMKREQTEINEVDFEDLREPAIRGAIISLVISIALVFYMLSIFMSAGKRNKKLEAKLKGVLKDGKNWKVYIMKDDSPNAFCIIRPVMFIHSGLVKIMNERELMAVMLHEAGHINNKDLIKHLSIRSSFTALMIGALSVTSAPVWVPITALIFLGIHHLGLTDIVFKMTFGRRGEKKADSHAVKYGYGDDLVTALEKIYKWTDKIVAKRPCGKLCVSMKKIGEITDEHPPLEKRVTTILKKKETFEKTKRFSFLKVKQFFSDQLES